MIRIITAALIFLCLSSCVNYDDVRLLELENVSINKITGKGIDADIWLKIDNPNNYKIKVEAKDLTFSINGKEIGKAKLSEPVTLEKSKEQSYQAKVYISIPPDGNIDLGVLLLMSGGQIKMALEGEVTGKAKGISKTVKVDVSESISL